MLGVSHSGIRLIKRNRDHNFDGLILLEEFSLLDVREVHLPKESTINLVFNNTEKKIILYSHRVKKNFITLIFLEFLQNKL